MFKCYLGPNLIGICKQQHLIITHWAIGVYRGNSKCTCPTTDSPRHLRYL